MKDGNVFKKNGTVFNNPDPVYCDRASLFINRVMIGLSANENGGFSSKSGNPWLTLATPSAGGDELPYTVVAQYDGAGPWVPPTLPTFLAVGPHNVTIVARDRFGRQSSYNITVCLHSPRLSQPPAFDTERAAVLTFGSDTKL
jgi:hypothetical protein